MLKSADKKGGDITLKSVNYESAYNIPVNLLKGSDEATTTTTDEDSWFYKLSFGAKGSNYANIFGWFWGAADGAAFEIEAHRAWLAIPKGGQNAPTFYSLNGEATGIADIRGKLSEGSKAYYNLNGQRVANPSKGVFIVNGKIVIK